MIQARNSVEEFVQKQLENRNKHELELQGLWESNIVIFYRLNIGCSKQVQES